MADDEPSQPTTNAAAPARRLTLREIASELGVGFSTLRSWHRKHGMPGGRGKWDLDAIRAWMASRPDARYSTKRVPSKREQSELQRETARWRRARADKTELEVRQLRGELVPREHVIEMRRSAAHAFARSLRSRGARLATQLEGKRSSEIQAILAADAEEMLEIYRTAPTFLAAAEADEALSVPPEEPVQTSALPDAPAPEVPSE